MHYSWNKVEKANPFFTIRYALPYKKRNERFQLNISSTEIIILLAVLIIVGVVLSVIAHRNQQRREAKDRATKRIMGESILISQLLIAARIVPVSPGLYEHLTKSFGKLAVQLRRLDANHPELKGLAETLVSSEEQAPPNGHIPFPPGITLQVVQRDLKCLQSFLQQQFATSLERSNYNTWRNELTALRLDVEREYFVRQCEEHQGNGQKREAAQAINHALKLVSQAAHLNHEAKQAETERLKEVKSRLMGNAPKPDTPAEDDQPSD